MFNKIIELFYPFTNDVDKFVLKNKPSWFSNKYRYILYSGNGGKTFRKVLKAISPLFEYGDTILEYDWTFEYETFNCENISFQQYKDKFKSISDIENYIETQYQKYLNGKESVKLQRKQYLEKINKNIQ